MTQMSGLSSAIRPPQRVNRSRVQSGVIFFGPAHPFLPFWRDSAHWFYLLVYPARGRMSHSPAGEYTRCVIQAPRSKTPLVGGY